ncbi:adenylyltransferase/cytidyltransferase family protein [Candidatus Pacearchaeota archaeon]|nr:adenylyltransferase/cytidyltransferase family protein [Candidatus Pacearchaeota archaeon]
MEDKVIVAASGYFDPLHIGHVEYLREAKKLGDKLIVIVNNKKQTLMKKGFEFMPIKERIEIVKAMSFVDEVIESIDEDGSQCKTLEMLKPTIFAKGGDRFAYEIPETPICRKYGIEIIDGLGKKIQSSSELVKKSKELERKSTPGPGIEPGNP